jgi:hypothetical protein
MESRFGHDFSRVRIHDGPRASESARAVSAVAYTVGADIVVDDSAVPSSVGGRLGVLAHELAHVVQQGATHGSTGIGLVQRQRIKMPVFDEFDPCVTLPDPIKGGCLSDLRKLREKLKPKPGPKQPTCPPGFKPAGSSTFKGRCCPEKIVAENDRECCPPERIAANAVSPRCCPPETEPDADRKNCVAVSPEPATPPDCAPDRARLIGSCICKAPSKVVGFFCCPPGDTSVACVEAPAKPKEKPSTPARPVRTIEILFNKDAPQSWYDPKASFGVSVTTPGKTAFDGLVSEMTAHPELLVQLAGRASIEKPKAEPDYNLRLSTRRVQLIEAELGRRGIDAAARLGDPPGGPPGGCAVLHPGAVTCGDTGASPDIDEADRKVEARVFEPGATP